jgi:hypothetical protein
MASTTLSKIGHFLSGDMLFFVVVYILLFVAIAYFRKGKMISAILAFYPASILYNSFPFLDKLLFLHQDGMAIFNKFAVFLLFFVPIFIVVNSYETNYSSISNIISTGGLALIGLALIVMFSYTVINYDYFHDFSPSVDALFTPLNRIFYWNAGIFALLAFL